MTTFLEVDKYSKKSKFVREQQIKFIEFVKEYFIRRNFNSEEFAIQIWTQAIPFIAIWPRFCDVTPDSTRSDCLARRAKNRLKLASYSRD